MDLVLGPHQGRLKWPEVYANWQSNQYQYYWKKFSLNPVKKQPWPTDMTLTE